MLTTKTAKKHCAQNNSRQHYVQLQFCSGIFTQLSCVYGTK